MAEDTSAGSRDGRIVTFYSYKGGTGRTMALANVAWILAANGYRVLVADWDLESPGLHRFFRPFLDEAEVKGASGIIDMIRQYEQSAANAFDDAEAIRLIGAYAKVQPHALPVIWDHFPPGGSLEFLSAGRQNLDYSAALSGLDWDGFYEHRFGGEFLDAIRADLKQHYDYVLIDSRTGLSDIAGICTVQLPDVLVDCFTLSIQGIEGAAEVASSIEQKHKDRGILILPVPMRVDQAEKEKVEAGHATAVQLFAGFPSGMSETQRREYWAAVEVPYRAFYAYEETLAVFGDPPGSPASLLASFERLTAQITGNAVTSLPRDDEQLRNRTKALFARKTPLAIDEVVIAYCAQDQVWSDWIVEVLRAADIPVRDKQLDESLKPELESDDGRTLTVVSATYLARHRTLSVRGKAPDLAVFVTAARPPAEFYYAQSAFIAGLPETEAIEQIRKIVGAANRRAASARVRGARYPGIEPKINSALTPNVRFTGRDKYIRELRELLSESGPADVPPVLLHGLGGVGKTQVAIEYVHRFKTEYDVIWWLDCGQPQFIDATLADLATRLRDVSGIPIPTTDNAADLVHLVLGLLAEGQHAGRWLLIFDNAEYIDAVQRYLPRGGGHVLITSRLRDWMEHTRPLQIDVFSREESIEHLRKRIPSIHLAEATEVAELLGDFPLAVATAGAWLSETGTSVSRYVHELAQRAPTALEYKHLEEYPSTVSETWDLSLTRLKERSPAAARLFDLCSVMAPNIALELLNGPRMARLLEPFDPELTDPILIGRLVHEIDRLALIKLDLSSSQMRIHRLVQLVVRERMSEDEVADAEREMHEILAAARPSRGIDNPETWDRYRMLWPHLEYSGAMRSESEPVRQLLIDRVRYIWLRHDLERGRELAEELDQTWSEMLAATSEPGHADSLRKQLLHLRSLLANLLRDLARFSEAMALDESVLAEQRELLGADSPRTLTTAGGLAADLRALGQYSEALDTDMATYQAWVRIFGDGHPQALRAANNLAVSYRLIGDTTAALQLDEVTFQRRAAMFGPEHPQTLWSASAVVRDLIEAGQYAEAAARMEGIHDSYIKSSGADSVETMNAEVLLAIALRNVGNPERAEPRFLKALEDLTARLGSSSTEAMAARLAHGVNLLALGRAADAEREIQAVRAVYERRLGRSHPQTLVCLADLACALRTEAPLNIAVETARSALDGQVERLGDGHPYTLAAMSVLGVLLAETGDLAAADEIESRAVDQLATTLGPNHPDTLRSRANLLITREARGDGQAALDLTVTIGELAKIVGSDHPHVASLRAGHRLMHALDPQPF